MKFRHPAHADGVIPSLFNSVCHDPVILTTVAAVASIGGSVLSGIGQVQAGKAANVNAKFQAAQAEQQAGQEQATAQRVAIEERRKAAIVVSNVRAASAASGGGATDPTVLNIEGGIAQQGEYNAMSALFEGEERSKALKLQAASTRMEGKQAKKAGMIGGVSTIISGASTIISGTSNALMAKYAPSSAFVPTKVTSQGALPWQAAGNVNPTGGITNGNAS